VPKRSSETAAYDRYFRKEAEIDDIRAFLRAYERATGEALVIEEMGESPDAVCRRGDGTQVGVEHTQVRRSPQDAHWASVLDHRDEMDVEETIDEINRLIFQKAELRKNFQTPHTILMLAVCESDFDLAVAFAKDIPLEDLLSTGFEEIWLADFKAFGTARTGKSPIRSPPRGDSVPDRPKHVRPKAVRVTRPPT
jgi:hypothetical protein